jgi:hypothetical protein
MQRSTFWTKFHRPVVKERLHANGQAVMGAADPRRTGYAVGW